ncbi:hypothetical protein [Pseudoduganella lutea]|uniref:Uncharacterized protein n=1 Tax=Pseudoduganella lutea TaxID=321985 RepID=A0A4P6KWZ9_9BURK|nr:hypothetical protein [Pseudoduganella lutea]QBE63334.1 hypothetical protein EWM63_10465 [Pseudoduganella lutea]
MKRISLYLISVILTGSFVYLYLDSENQSNSPGLLAKETAQPNYKLGPTVAEGKPPTDGCASTPPLYDPVAFKGSEDRESLEEKVEEAYLNPQMLFAKTETDPQANIALYRMFSSCGKPPTNVGGHWQSGGGGCPTIESANIFRLHPIELLSKAAAQGSTEAKTMFALNAPVVAFQLSKDDSPDKQEFAKRLLSEARKLGAEAAYEGDADAYRVMSESFTKGWFGTKNIELAYSYSLPLEVLGNANDKEQIARLGGLLTTTQQDIASKATYGCSNSVPPGILSNPFG